MQIRSLLAFSLFLLLPLLSNSQSEEPPFGKAPIEGIETGGYYRLSVPPRLQKHCQLDLADLRIQDSKGEEVPYILDEAPSFQHYHELRTLKILKKESLPNGGGILQIEDPAKDTIPALSLKVDQGPVSRTIRIEGSNDLENWEELHPSQRYHDERYKDRVRAFILRDLELSGYRFYKIHLGAEGEGFDPKILKARAIRIQKAWKSYQKVPAEDFQVTEKEDRTYIRPVFDAPSYRADGIDLELEERDYFYRRGYLARGNPEKPDSIQKLESFDITSYGELEIRLNGYRSQNLLLVIKDGDLPALEVKDLKVYQRERQLLFRTRNGASHSLHFGDRKAQKPRYELPHFRQQMPDQLQKASVGDIQWNGPPLSSWGKMEKKDEAKSRYRVWTVIGIVLIWLFGVTVLVSIGILLYRRVI